MYPTNHTFCHGRGRRLKEGYIALFSSYGSGVRDLSTEEAPQQRAFPQQRSSQAMGFLIWSRAYLFFNPLRNSEEAFDGKGDDDRNGHRAVGG